MPAPKRTKFFLIFGLLWIVLGSPFFFVGRYLYNLNKQYETEGIKVTGTVIDMRVDTKYDSKEKREVRTYRLRYRFTPENAQPIESEDSVSFEDFESHKKDGPIEIEYLKSDPQTNRSAQSTDNVVGYVFMGIGMFTALLGSAFIFGDLKARRKQSRLMTDGMLVEGVIKRIEEGTLSINRVRQMRIRYEFKDFMGHTHEALSEHMSPNEALLLSEGKKGKVRYSKENPKESLWIGDAA